LGGRCEIGMILRCWAEKWAGLEGWQSFLNKTSLEHEIEKSLPVLRELLGWLNAAQDSAPPVIVVRASSRWTSPASTGTTSGPRTPTPDARDAHRSRSGEAPTSSIKNYLLHANEAVNDLGSLLPNVLKSQKNNVKFISLVLLPISVFICLCCTNLMQKQQKEDSENVDTVLNLYHSNEDDDAESLSQVSSNVSLRSKDLKSAYPK